MDPAVVVVSHSNIWGWLAQGFLIKPGEDWTSMPRGVSVAGRLSCALDRAPYYNRIGKIGTNCICYASAQARESDGYSKSAPTQPTARASAPNSRISAIVFRLARW